MPMAMAMEMGAETRLSPEQIRDRLRLRSRPLVETVYDLALQQTAMEERRQTALDSRAQSLLTAAALSNTVAFTFGGILLQHPDCLWSAGSGLLWPVIVVYGIALVSGLLASATALRALWIRDDVRKIDENDYLRRTELIEADRAADDDVVGGTTRYKQYLIVNLIKLHRAHYDLHERKAVMVRNGQIYFALFLAGIMLIGAAITTTTLGRASSIQVGQSPPPRSEDVPEVTRAADGSIREPSLPRTLPARALPSDQDSITRRTHATM